MPDPTPLILPAPPASHSPVRRYTLPPLIRPASQTSPVSISPLSSSRNPDQATSPLPPMSATLTPSHTAPSTALLTPHTSTNPLSPTTPSHARSPVSPPGPLPRVKSFPHVGDLLGSSSEAGSSSGSSPDAISDGLQVQGRGEGEGMDVDRPTSAIRANALDRGATLADILRSIREAREPIVNPEPRRAVVGSTDINFSVQPWTAGNPPNASERASAASRRSAYEPIRPRVDPRPAHLQAYDGEAEWNEMGFHGSRRQAQALASGEQDREVGSEGREEAGRRDSSGAAMRLVSDSGTMRRDGSSGSSSTSRSDLVREAAPRAFDHGPRPEAESQPGQSTLRRMLDQARAEEGATSNRPQPRGRRAREGLPTSGGAAAEYPVLAPFYGMVGTSQQTRQIFGEDNTADIENADEPRRRRRRLDGPDSLDPQPPAIAGSVPPPRTSVPFASDPETFLPFGLFGFDARPRSPAESTAQTVFRTPSPATEDEAGMFEDDYIDFSPDRAARARPRRAGYQMPEEALVADDEWRLESDAELEARARRSRYLRDRLARLDTLRTGSGGWAGSSSGSEDWYHPPPPPRLYYAGMASAERRGTENSEMASVTEDGSSWWGQRPQNRRWISQGESERQNAAAQSSTSGAGGETVQGELRRNWNRHVQEAVGRRLSSEASTHAERRSNPYPTSRVQQLPPLGSRERWWGELAFPVHPPGTSSNVAPSRSHRLPRAFEEPERRSSSGSASQELSGSATSDWRSHHYRRSSRRSTDDEPAAAPLMEHGNPHAFSLLGPGMWYPGGGGGGGGGGAYPQPHEPVHAHAHVPPPEYYAERRMNMVTQLRFTPGMSDEDKRRVAGLVARGVKGWPGESRRKAAESTVRATTYAALGGEEDWKGEGKRDVCCAVCHDEYEDETKLAVTPCQHMYHKSCLETWLQQPGTSSCPMCRRDLAVLACMGKMVPSKTVGEALQIWLKM